MIPSISGFNPSIIPAAIGGTLPTKIIGIVWAIAYWTIRTVAL